MEKPPPEVTVRGLKAVLMIVVFKYLIKVPGEFAARLRLRDYLFNLNWKQKKSPTPRGQSTEGDVNNVPAATEPVQPAATPSTSKTKESMAPDVTDEEIAQYAPHFIVPLPRRFYGLWSQAVKSAYKIRYSLYSKSTLASNTDLVDLPPQLRRAFLAGAALWGSNVWMAVTLGLVTLLLAATIVVAFSIWCAYGSFNVIVAAPVVKVIAAACTAYVAVVILVAALLVAYASPALLLRLPLVQGAIVSALLYVGLIIGSSGNPASALLTFACYAVIVFRVRLTAFVRPAGFLISFTPLLLIAWLKVVPLAVVTAAQMLVVLQLLILGAWYVGTLLWRLRERLYRRDFPMSLSTDALAFAVFIYENASHMPPDTSQAPAERRVLQSLRTVASLMRAIAASLFVNNAMIDGEVERMFERCAATVREIAVSVALPDEQSRSRTLSKLFDLLIAACKENWGASRRMLRWRTWREAIVRRKCLRSFAEWLRL